MTTDMNGPDMSGKVVMITGATGGLGREAALALAALGPRLYLVVRNPALGTALVQKIEQRTGNTDVHVLVGDLSSTRSVQDIADRFLETGDPLHVLLNNAGAVFGFRRRESKDGVEMTLALNHLGYFTLTNALLPTLRASAPARIVNVASDAYKDAKGRFDFDDYNAEQHYRPIRQYGRSKLANLLFTQELHERLVASGVTVNAVSPPRTTATGFAKNVHPLARVAMTVASPFLLSPRRAVEPIVHLCAAPETADLSGTYWSGMRQPLLPPTATNAEDARRLWELSEKLTGLVWAA